MKMVYGKKRSKVSAAIILCLMFGLSTMTVCAVTLESAEQYVEVKRETTEDTRQEKDKQHVEFVEEGKTPGIQVVQGQINEVARSQHTFNWVVNGNTMMKGPYFHCNAGGLVAFSVNILPTSVTVNVGIESSSGKRQYLYCNAEESYVFNISDADDYFFFVENTSNVAVTVTGGYLIP